MVVQKKSDSFLFKYIFEADRYPKWVVTNIAQSNPLRFIRACIRRKEYQYLRRYINSSALHTFEYLNAVKYYLAYPLITVLILLIFGTTFTYSQAGCVLVAFAVLVEGTIILMIESRLERLAIQTIPVARLKPDKYPFEIINTSVNKDALENQKRLQTLHPTLLKWSLVNAILGTLLWGFAPA